MQGLEKGVETVAALEQVPWTGHRWSFIENLKYTCVDSVETPRCSCVSCPRTNESSLLNCSKCGACYCSKDCQKNDWRTRHKEECPMVAALLSPNQDPQNVSAMSKLVVEHLLRRIRMYMCPYNVVMSEARGRGLVFVKSQSPIRQWIFGEQAIDHKGYSLSRNVQMQYLSLGEWDTVAFENDFEMALIRPQLQVSLDEYDPKSQFVVVVLLGCGFFGCCILPLVPDYNICLSLGKMYEYEKIDVAIQLNVDAKD